MEKKLSFALFFAGFLFCTCQARVEDPWRPLNWTELPPALSDDAIDVYYLVAPLLQEDVGPLLGELNLFHGAIGFVNQRTKFSITVNYDANDFFHASLFPRIVKDENNSKALQWNNGGSSFIYSGIHEPYWCTLNVKVAVTTGEIYNDFISTWNSKINTTVPYYNMFSVLRSFGEEPWIPSWECFDFVWSSFHFLAERGTTFLYSSARRDYTNIYASKAPLKVTDLYNTESAYRTKVIHFYEVIQLHMKEMDILELLWTLVELFEGEFFLRQSQDYYQVHLHWPFAGLDWEPAPLPNPLPQAPPLTQWSGAC